MVTVVTVVTMVTVVANLSQVDSAISVGVLGMHLLPYCFPGGLQPLTPRAPGRIEVPNDCMES